MLRIVLVLCLGLGFSERSMAASPEPDIVPVVRGKVLEAAAPLAAQIAKAEGKEIDDGLAAIIEAGKKIPRVAAALAREESYREAMTTDFIRQLAELAEIWERREAGDKTDVAKTAILKVVVKGLQQDLIHINAFNAEVRERAVAIVGYPLQSNKMGEFIESDVKKKGVIGWAIDLLNLHGKTLITGNVPEGYAVAQATVTMLGENPVSVFGSSKASSLQMALMALLAHMKGKRTFEELGKELSAAMTSKAVAHARDPHHIADLFSHLNPQCRFRIGNSLLTVHTGYIYGPLDCSSEAAEATATPPKYRFTTGNLKSLAEPFRVKPAQVTPATVKWLATLQGQFLAKKFGFVKVENPLEDIIAGDLWHKGGHTAFILGVLPNGKIVTLGRNRNMPTMEGFGLQLFSYALDTNIFRINE